MRALCDRAGATQPDDGRQAMSAAIWLMTDGEWLLWYSGGLFFA